MSISVKNQSVSERFHTMLMAAPAGHDYLDSPCDIVADLLHYLHQNNLSLADTLRIGIGHFLAETDGEEAPEYKYAGRHKVDEETLDILKSVEGVLR